jgi:hypothetical protein
MSRIINEQKKYMLRITGTVMGHDLPNIPRVAPLWRDVVLPLLKEEICYLKKGAVTLVTLCTVRQSDFLR